ncbi:MAG: hypothetical protein ACRD2L_19735, partial [Terriglobia bacterium]
EWGNLGAELLRIIAYGLVGVFGERWRARKRPQIVLCKVVQDFQFPNIAGKTGGALQVTMGGTAVANARLFVLDIVNTGTEDITEYLEIRFRFPHARVLEAEGVPDPLGMAVQAGASTADVDGHEAMTIIPNLNAFNPHQNKVRMSLILDGSSSKFEPIAAGKGWSVRVVPLADPSDSNWRHLNIAVAFAVLAGFGISALLWPRAFQDLLPTSSIGWIFPSLLLISGLVGVATNLWEEIRQSLPRRRLP